MMDDYIGGANYIESHRMIFGNDSYINEGATNQNNNMEIYTYPYEKGGVKPLPKVMADGRTLELNKDYSLSYTNNNIINNFICYSVFYYDIFTKNYHKTGTGIR